MLPLLLRLRLDLPSRPTLRSRCRSSCVFSLSPLSTFVSLAYVCRSLLPLAATSSGVCCVSFDTLIGNASSIARAGAVETTASVFTAAAGVKWALESRSSATHSLVKSSCSSFYD